VCSSDLCKGLVEGNIFLSNLAGSRNDGGALFVALWSSTEIKNNIFVDNESGDDAGALFVGGQEHRYDSPLDPYPNKDEFYVTIENNTFIGNRNPTMNSGAMRFTMESRGKFSNNIVAQNNGVYFQRSETEITNNLILDNMLVIETKEGLDKSVIKDNLIYADFILDETVAEVKNNMMLYADKFKGNKKIFLKIKNDGNVIKFVDKVDQVSISGSHAVEIGQPVVIVTERGVFECTRDGLILKEIAPGISLEENILSKMEFKPIIARDIKEMPAGLFYDQPMDLVKSFFI